MTRISRRTLLTAAGATAAAAMVGPAASAGARVRHAIIGTGGQGRHHALVFSRHPLCEVVALCDVDPERLQRVVAELGDSNPPRVETDYRRVLDDPAIDSVSIVTPDHWHTKLALHALEAGKHVYIEKPCSHTIEEAHLLMRAAAASGKCVQHGTHSRGSAGIAQGIAYLQAGHLGTVRAAKAINHQFRAPIGRAEEASPPEGVDYDMWLGPAPVRPFTLNRWHYNWHWFWEYGCGDIANDGIHQLDQVLWGLDVGLPTAVCGSGGQLFYDDDHETPDTQLITFEYERCHVIYEMRLWTKYPLEGHDNGVVFYGDDGTMSIGRDGCIAHPIGEEPFSVGGGASLEENAANYLEAVMADDPSLLLAPMDKGAISTAVCHMGNIATRLGRRLHFDRDTWQFDDAEANALRSRPYRAGYELPAIA